MITTTTCVDILDAITEAFFVLEMICDFFEKVKK